MAKLEFIEDWLDGGLEKYADAGITDLQEYTDKHQAFHQFLADQVGEGSGD